MHAGRIITNNLAIVSGLGGLEVALEEPAGFAAEHCKVRAQL
jgi:hypothetical protein